MTLMVNNLVGFGAAAGEVGPAATIARTDTSIDTSNANVYTFTTQATGTADATRKTIIVVHAFDSATDFSTSGVTVGGVAATLAKDSANASALVQTSIWIIDNPSGTTADVVVTFSESVLACTIEVYKTTNLLSMTPTATATAYSATAASLDLSLNVDGGGIAVAGGTSNGNVNATWTGMTEGTDAAAAGFSTTDATYAAASSQSPLTVGCDFDGASPSIGASASFR